MSDSAAPVRNEGSDSSGSPGKDCQRRDQMGGLVSTSAYTGLATVVGYASGFIVNKVIAVKLGPSGIALVSQFQNFVGISTTLASGGFQQGIVKYVAEYRVKTEHVADVLSTALRLTIVFAFVAALAITVSASALSTFLLGSVAYRFVFTLFGLTVVLFGLNSMLVSILNGMGDIKKLVVVRLCSNAFTVVFTTGSTLLFGLAGALTALAISQSVIFFVAWAFARRSGWFSRRLFANRLHIPTGWKLAKYSLMALSSMVLPPVVQITIRNHIIDTVSMQAAGYWDGVWKISTAYLGLITTTLSVYYLPKLSALESIEDIREEVLGAYKVVMPVAVTLALVIFFARDQIVLSLFSRDFLEMRTLFGPQLLGDVLMIASWIVAYLMLAKARTWLFISTQIIFSFLTLALSVSLVKALGLSGVVWAHAIKYGVYLVFMLLLFRRYVFRYVL